MTDTPPQRYPQNPFQATQTSQNTYFEAKDGKYGQDGSELLADYKSKAASPVSFQNSLGDLKKNIEYIIGMERQSGNIDTPTPQDIASLLNVPIEEVELSMNEMGLL